MFKKFKRDLSGMTRILVVSDTHGRKDRLLEAILAQPQAKVVIHLGDGIREAEEMADRFPKLIFYIVRGNCDLFSPSHIPPLREETVGGRRLFMTHGHLYGVKEDLYRLECAARERQVHMALFGHTHRPLSTYHEGLYLFNPGSLAYTHTYGTVDITPDGLVPNIVEL